MIERIYYNETDTEGNSESICGHPKFNSTTEITDATKELFRDVLQQAMESEPDGSWGKNQRTSETAEENKPWNYRNGYSKKAVKTQLGSVEKILGLYACGTSQRDISGQIKSLYDVDISPELVNKISEKIMPEVTAWISSR